jgi:protein SCO1/2
MNSRRIALIVILAVILVALSVTPLFLQRTAAKKTMDIQLEPESLYDVGAVPDFSLIDSTGTEFTGRQLSGKIWVADLFLTSCQGACPVMTKNMKILHDKYASDDRVKFVSISTDPDTDTPEVLAQYVKDHELDPARWHFLTGPIEEIHRMASEEGFKVGVPETPMGHSQRFVLIDARGHIRGYYDGMDEADAIRLGRDIDRLLQGDA